MKILIFCLILLSGTSALFAQEKPLRKYSKKQLIAMLEAERVRTDSLANLLLVSENENKALEAKTANLESDIHNLQKRLEEDQRLRFDLQKRFETLNKQYVGLCEAPPKEVEVLDLYGFGYQPLQYSEKEYQKQLKIAREAVVDFRMNNVLDLIRLLQSHKVEDEMKKVLYQSFKKAYRGYLDQLTQAQLTFYNPKIEASLKRGIRQKTSKEFSQVELENRWIQLLESY